VAMKHKALLVLNDKLKEGVGQLSKTDIRWFVRLLDDLGALMMIEQPSPSSLEEDASCNSSCNSQNSGSIQELVVANQQAALLSAEILVQRFGSIEPDAFVIFMPKLLGKSTLESPIPQVAATSMICLASFVAELGPRTIDHLPIYMPRLLEQTTNICTRNMSSSSSSIHYGRRRSRHQVSREQLFQWSALSSLSTIITALPQFMTPYLSNIMACLLHPNLFDILTKQSINEKESAQNLPMVKNMTTLPSLSSGNGESGSFSKAVRKIYKIVATKMAPRHVIPTMCSHVYATCVSRGRTSLLLFYEPWNEILANLSKEDIAAHLLLLLQFYLDAFEAHIHGNDSSLDGIQMENEVHTVNLSATVESKLIESCLALVVKLTEASFKPFFLKCMDWATRNEDENDDSKQVDRWTLFYHLVSTFISRLKMLFVPYMNYILDHILKLLSIFPSIYETHSALSLRLWAFLLESLKHAFEYSSTQEWIDNALFDKLVVPLVEQLNYRMDGKGSSDKRFQDYWIPCLVQLAIAAPNETCWKSLNYQLLLKTRDPNPSVRWHALSAIQELYRQLGEEFLILLPETVPYLAELMEDEHHEVETCCHHTITVIEGYLGESLQKYLQ
jgi:U3 small nucleolar RNA-associated protein 10